MENQRSVSVYSLSFGHGEPSLESSKQIAADTSKRYDYKNRVKTCIGNERSSVASCMIWQRPEASVIKAETKNDQADMKTNSSVHLN